MEVSIKGGDTGKVAKVDTNNRLHTQTVTESESIHAAESGDAFNVIAYGYERIR